MIHQLKIKREFFNAVISGQKQFEVRENDRNFKVGDALALNEIGVSGTETGRCTLAEITFIFANDTDASKWGVMPGYVVMSIMPLSISYADKWDVYDIDRLTRFDLDEQTEA